jgi:transposase-like protein
MSRAVIVTNKLRSYSAWTAEVMRSVEHLQQKYPNNRDENSQSANQIARAGNETV